MDAIWGGAIGGLLGVLATTAGVFLAHFMTEHKRKQRHREDFAKAVTLVALELRNQRDDLDDNKPISRFSCTAFQVLQSNYFLVELPSETAMLLLDVYELFERINDRIDQMRSGVLANIAANDPQAFSVDKIRKDIDILRHEALGKTDECLKLLKPWMK